MENFYERLMQNFRHSYNAVQIILIQNNLIFFTVKLKRTSVKYFYISLSIPKIQSWFGLIMFSGYWMCIQNILENFQRLIYSS